jgi:hypothetical protein
MARFTPDPKRDAAAKLLAKTGHSWARVTTRAAHGAFPAGSKFFGIPSSKNDGTAYYTNLKMCTCPDYQQRGAICKHMRAVDLYATELRQKRQQQEGSDESSDPTPEAVVPLMDYRDLYPGCVAGCGELVERRGERCYACLQVETRRLETTEKIAAVAATATQSQEMPTMTIEQMLADYSANPTLEGVNEIRAALAEQPCDGVTTYSYFPKDGNGVGMEVRCGYVFNEQADSVLCTPCEIRRQVAQFAAVGV